MKKFAALSLLLVLQFSGCEKNNHQESAIQKLLDNVTNITRLSDDELLQKFSSKVLEPNEYLFVGELVYKGMVEFEKSVSLTGAKYTQADSLIINIVYSTIPKEYSSLSDENISESEGEIYKNITKSLAGTRPENVFYKLSIIEDLISRDEYVCKEAKTRLLVFISVYKYTCEFFIHFSMSSKRGEFEECFRKKMYHIFEESGILERLHCVVDWPVCLSVAAGDCAIEIIF